MVKSSSVSINFPFGAFLPIIPAHEQKIYIAPSGRSHLRPLDLFSLSKRMSRRRCKFAVRSITNSCGPVNAAIAAAWLTAEEPDVLCDCIFDMLAIISLGPPAKPTRHPVME